MYCIVRKWSNYLGFSNISSKCRPLDMRETSVYGEIRYSKIGALAYVPVEIVIRDEKLSKRAFSRKHVCQKEKLFWVSLRGSTSRWWRERGREERVASRTKGSASWRLARCLLYIESPRVICNLVADHLQVADTRRARGRLTLRWMG